MNKTLEVGKVYKNSDRQEVIIEARINHPNYPFIGRVVDDHNWPPMSYTPLGTLDRKVRFSGDLIIPQPKKLIDWSKMPKGTMTSEGELLDIDNDGYPVIIKNKLRSFAYTQRSLRLAEQKEFTYWGGVECPVPEGVIVEVVYRDKSSDIRSSLHFDWGHDTSNLNYLVEIIAYRIIGLAEGYTDNPEDCLC